MAKERKASVIYEGNASQLVYAFPFDYLRKKFVKVEDIYTNITELTIGVDYTVEDKQVRLVKGIPLGHSVKIYRETTTAPLVEWQDASVLRSADLSLQEVQLLHLAEETGDRVFDSGMSTAYDNPNCWDGQYKRIINALDPIEDGDVVTLRYIKANQDSLLNQLKNTGETQNARLIATGDAQNRRITGTGNEWMATLNAIVENAKKWDPTNYFYMLDNAALWKYLHRFGVNPTLPTTNVDMNKMGVFSSFVSGEGKFNNQPTPWGQLINLPATNDSEEATQLWIEQYTGKMWHRGGNGDNNISNTPFTRFLDTDDTKIVTVPITIVDPESIRDVTCLKSGHVVFVKFAAIKVKANGGASRDKALITGLPHSIPNPITIYAPTRAGSVLRGDIIDNYFAWNWTPPWTTSEGDECMFTFTYFSND